MPGTFLRADRRAAQRPRGRRKEEEGPQGTRGYEVGAHSGTSGHREGGFDSRIRATAVLQTDRGLENDKIALGVLLDEGRPAAYDLQQNLRKNEVNIAYLNTKLSALESGTRDKAKVHNSLQMKLTATAAAEATSMMKWDTERQQLRDEIVQAQREERRAK